MENAPDGNSFLELVQQFSPEHEAGPRLAAMYSATIAAADPLCQRAAIRRARELGRPRSALYEVVLQSYLFLGFPRMLKAAEVLHTEWPPNEDHESQLRPVSGQEGKRWYERGMELYTKVYDSNRDLLRRRVEAMAPEVFRWMVIEGYGKVLSRQGLPVLDRELAVVACLLVENHVPQLHSHMRGALNVGCTEHLLRTVVEDVGTVAGDGYRAARDIMERLQTAG